MEQRCCCNYSHSVVEISHTVVHIEMKLLFRYRFFVQIPLGGRGGGGGNCKFS